jgi:hypothetical protein
MVSTEDGSNHYWACAVCGKYKPNRMSSLTFGNPWIVDASSVGPAAGTGATHRRRRVNK